MTPRYAAYYAPAVEDPLWRAGCAWLGRDPAGGVVGPPPDLPDIAAVTEAARGYGFHATLKPPMRLREGVTRDALIEAMALVASAISPFVLPKLVVRDFHGFLCLREAHESAALQALCDAVVAGLDHLREPPGEAELAKRRGPGLSPTHEANLLRWGYPDVFAEWFFHMTLSRRLAKAEMDFFRPAAKTWFADALASEREVRAVCLYEQPCSGTDFVLTEFFPLGARPRPTSG